jgi:16S rRNA G966 N2-methylase RsmD
MVTKLPVNQLENWEQNPREIDKEHLVKLVKYIKKYGLLTPLLVDGRDNKTVLGGNMRLQALRELKVEEIEVNIVNIKSDAEAVEIALLDNNQFGRYVEGELISLVDNFPELDLTDFEIDLKPISLSELQRSVDVEPEVEEDNFEPPKEAKYQIEQGEIWQLGDHRLMCGDSTKIEDIEKLMDGQKAGMVFTDPPYGISLRIGSGNGNGITNKNDYKYILNDDDTVVARDVFYYIQTLNIPIIYWGANYFTDFLPPSRCWIVWNKKEGLPQDDFVGIELAYTNLDKHSMLVGIQWKGMIKQGETGQKRVHPNQKPIQLIVEVINYAGDGGSVIDLFGGSGSTLIACEQLKRKCYMMELDPYYCSVIIERWEKLTGKEAVKLG